MTERPFDLKMFASPLARLVRIDVATVEQTLSGGFTPEQARILGRAMLGAADVAENNMTSEDAVAFLTIGTSFPEEGNRSSS